MKQQGFRSKSSSLCIMNKYSQINKMHSVSLRFGSAS